MIRNAVDFVKLVEARLGWAPPSLGVKRYIAEAGKVKRRVASDPELYSWHNLELAVELLARERQPRTPIGVFAHVTRAVEKAVEPDDDVELQIRQAVAYEERRGDPAGWTTRFARATGIYRAQALTEWKESAR